MKFYIGCYTNSVKEYADRQFFDNLTLIAGDNPVCVVDNTIEPGYTDRLKELTLYIPNVEVHHIDVPEEPKRTQFLRNVADSANFIRDRFLESDADHLVIIEK